MKKKYIIGILVLFLLAMVTSVSAGGFRIYDKCDGTDATDPDTNDFSFFKSGNGNVQYLNNVLEVTSTNAASTAILIMNGTLNELNMYKYPYAAVNYSCEYAARNAALSTFWGVYNSTGGNVTVFEKKNTNTDYVSCNEVRWIFDRANNRVKIQWNDSNEESAWEDLSNINDEWYPAVWVGNPTGAGQDSKHRVNNIGCVNCTGEYINITSPSPFDEAILVSEPVVFNLSGNFSFETNCSLYINNSFNVSTNYSAAKNVEVAFSVPFNMNENFFDYTINCSYNSTVFEKTSTNNFIFGATMNFTFRDAVNKSIVKWEKVYLELISAIKSYNFSTIYGNLSIALITPATYTLRYYSEDAYPLHHYELTVINGTLPLTLYMTNSTTQITTTTYDQTTLSVIEGAMVYLQRYDQSTNTYNTVAMYESDAAGKSYFWATTDEFYRFLVDSPFGTRRLETEKMYLQESNVNLYITLTEEVAQTYFDEISIISSITGDRTTRTFTATWTDAANVASQFCLFIKEHQYYGRAIVNESCSTANSGSLVLGFPGENKTYYALLTATIGSEGRTIATGWLEFVDDKLEAGEFGIFLSVVLIILFTLMGAFNIFALILANAGLIFSKALGLLQIEWGWVFTICIASLILGMIIQMKKNG